MVGRGAAWLLHATECGAVTSSAFYTLADQRQCLRWQCSFLNKVRPWTFDGDGASWGAWPMCDVDARSFGVLVEARAQKASLELRFPVMPHTTQ